ncbi:AsmA family protein [Coprobacter fastidiosus]|uniref:AsmA family protein n=1 Tax=Coprobacter fastidiosus TaxID=1099853 RepID=UPI0026755A98|nr:AsmA-like C-terminal region-containing protein [Coprobacter fastidiosus]
MNTKVKKGLKITGIVIGTILVIMLVLPFAFKGKILEIVKKEANNMLNAKLEFADLNLSFFSHFPKASIELQQLSLTGIGDFEKDTLVSAKEIDIAVNIMSLFGDKGIEINHIILEKPQVKAIKSANGNVNWDIMKPDTTTTVETDTTSSNSSFALKLKKFTIEDGRIAYIDDSSKMEFHTRKLNLKLSGDMSAESTSVDCHMTTQNIDFISGAVPYLKNAEFEMEMKVLADLANNKFTFDENKLRLNAIELNLDGWIALLEKDMDMDIRLNSPKIEFKDILSLIPGIYQNNFESLTAKGALDFKAAAKGKMTDNLLPQFSFLLNVKDGMINYADMPKAIDNINIHISAENPGDSADLTTLSIDNLSFKMAGNPFKLTLNASTPVSDLNFKATANGTLNLNMIKDVYPLGDSVKLSGILTTALSFAGKMSDIEKEKYQNIQGEGNISISNMNFTTPGIPAITLKKASATISPKAMSLNEMDVNIGKNDLQAKGSLSNYLPYFLKNETLKGNLSLTSSYLNLNDFMSDSEEVSTETEGKTDTTTMSVIEVPENLDLSLKANLKKVIFQKIEIDNISGNLSVSKGVVRMNPLNFNAFGGSVSTTGSYSTAENKNRPMVNFGLNIQKASFEETFKQLDMIQKIVPIFAKTGGNYSVNLDLKTPLDKTMSPELMSLTAKGVLQSNDIHVQNLEVFDKIATLLKNDKLKNIETKDIKIPFTIENGLLKTDPFDIKMGNISMNLSGTTGLDQSIDYTAKIALPESATGGYISNVTATIGGTFSKPEIKLDTKEMINNAVKTAVNSQLTKLTGKDKEERIAALREQADAAGKKLVETAEKEGQKLIDKAQKPLEKIGAKTAAAALVKEAQKQADKLKEEAEKAIQKIEAE